MGLAALAEKIDVVWNARMRSTAGRAWWPHGKIEMNAQLKSFDAAVVNRILRHELAHLIAHHRAGRKRIAPHGAEWRQACADLGIPDEKSCHRLPLQHRQQRIKYAYRCPKCQTEIKRVRKIKYAAACHYCCLEHNGGRYDARFRLIATELP